MKTLYSIILPTILIVLLTNCKENPSNPKDEDTLTPLTQTGEGTLSFILDGSPWVPRSCDGTPFGRKGKICYLNIDPQNLDRITKNKIDDYIHLKVVATKLNPREHFSFSIDSVLNEGKYLLKDAEFGREFSDSASEYNIDYYKLDTSYSDSNFIIFIKITRCYKPAYYEYRGNDIIFHEGSYSSDSTIMSGTFNLKLINKKGNKITISDGRFDL